MVLGVLTMESYEHVLDLCFLFLFYCVAPYDYVLNMSIEHGKFYINWKVIGCFDLIIVPCCLRYEINKKMLNYIFIGIVNMQRRRLNIVFKARWLLMIQARC